MCIFKAIPRSPAADGEAGNTGLSASRLQSSTQPTDHSVESSTESAGALSGGRPTTVTGKGATELLSLT